MALSFTIPGGLVQLSGNSIWIKVAGAVAPALSTNYKVLLRITSSDGQLRGGPFVDGEIPYPDGTAEFNISALVDKPFAPLFEWPLSTASYGYSAAAWNVLIEIGETYIDSSRQRIIHYNADDGSIPEGEMIQIIKGGISENKIGLYNETHTTFFDQIIAKGKFLTNQPSGIKVSYNQPVKLFLISPYTENTNIDIITTAYYADGSTQVYTEHTELWLDGMFEYTMHPKHLGIPAVKTGSPMVKFTIEWGDPATVGDIREYIIDTKYHEIETYIIFSNSKGGVDIIRCTGSIKKATDTTSAEGVQSLDETSTSRTPQVIRTAISSRKKFSINTGFKSAAEIEALEDLYLSQNIWIVVGQNLYPLVIEDGNFSLSDSMEEVHSAELTFKSAYIKRHF